MITPVAGSGPPLWTTMWYTIPAPLATVAGAVLTTLRSAPVGALATVTTLFAMLLLETGSDVWALTTAVLLSV